MLLTGITMIAAKERRQKLAAVHRTNVWILALAQVAGFVFAILKI